MVKQLFIQLKRPVGACDYYRAILPAKFLTPLLKDYGVDVVLAYDYTLFPRASATVIQRYAEPELVTYLLARQASGMSIAYDVDDDLLSIPAWSPVKFDKKLIDCVVASRSIADSAWCSTPVLAQKMSGWSNARQPRAITLPNLLDLDAWDGGQQHPTDKNFIRICWSGSSTHDKNLDVVSDAMGKIFSKYQHAQMLYFGDEPPASWLRNWFDRITHFPSVQLNLYPKMLRQLKPHICIAPLTTDKFNESKSAIRLLGSTMAGAAVVASSMPPYQIEKQKICRYALTTEEWVDTLSELIESHDSRRSLQEFAHDRVVANWTWQRSPYAKLWQVSAMSLLGFEPTKQES